MEIKNKCLFSWEKFSWVKYLVFNSFQRAEKIQNFSLIIDYLKKTFGLIFNFDKKVGSL